VSICCNHLIIVSRILPLSTQNIPSYTHGDFSALHEGLKRVVAGKEFGFAWRIDMSTLSSVASGLLIVSSASLWTASRQLEARGCGCKWHFGQGCRLVVWDLEVSSSPVNSGIWGRHIIGYLEVYDCPIVQQQCEALRRCKPVTCHPVRIHARIW